MPGGDGPEEDDPLALLAAFRFFSPSGVAPPPPPARLLPFSPSATADMSHAPLVDPPLRRQGRGACHPGAPCSRRARCGPSEPLSPSGSAAATREAKAFGGGRRDSHTGGERGEGRNPVASANCNATASATTNLRIFGASPQELSRLEPQTTVKSTAELTYATPQRPPSKKKQLIGRGRVFRKSSKKKSISSRVFPIFNLAY